MTFARLASRVLRTPALQRLYLRLLVHAQDDGVPGRVHVQSDHIPELRLEVGVVVVCIGQNTSILEIVYPVLHRDDILLTVGFSLRQGSLLTNGGEFFLAETQGGGDAVGL